MKSKLFKIITIFLLLAITIFLAAILFFAFAIKNSITVEQPVAYTPTKLNNFQELKCAYLLSDSLESLATNSSKINLEVNKDDASTTTVDLNFQSATLKRINNKEIQFIAFASKNGESSPNNPVWSITSETNNELTAIHDNESLILSKNTSLLIYNYFVNYETSLRQEASMFTCKVVN